MRGFIRATLAVLAIAFAVPAGASANIPQGLSQWYGLPGLDAAHGAGWVRSIAYTTVPTTVYAGTEGHGVFKSTNGGITWSEFNAGFDNPLTTNVRAISAGALPTSDVWAGTDSGLWKSSGGGPWKPIAQGPEDDPAQPKKLNESVQAIAGLTGGPMLAGVFSGGVYRSFDGGDTWVPPAVNNGMPSNETIWSLTVPLPNPLAVYATGSDGVFFSINAGASWTRVSDGIPDSATPLTTFPFSATKPNILYASTASNGIYRSSTAGVTWSEINDGLGAVRARGMQVFSSGTGARIYAATENGLWAGSQNASPGPAGTWLPSPPKWTKVADDGLITPSSTNTIMWALTAPAIPGPGGALGLIAGTQSNGGYFLAFEPVTNPGCPGTNTDNTDTDCPRLTTASLTPNAGDKLVLASKGLGWKGTPNIDLDVQWQVCTSASSGCSDIDDATDTTYVIPMDGNNKWYRAEITASNPAPNFGLIKRQTVITGKAAAAPSTLPGYNQISSPSLSLSPSGSISGAKVGDTLKANDGTSANANTDGIFNPKATSRAYRWWRCDNAQANCEQIAGATATTYKLTTDDGTHTIFARVTGTNSSGSATSDTGFTFPIISAPAGIAAAFPDPDHPGQFKSQAPAVAGDAYVGETLVGSVGGWKDPTTVFGRRWMRCDADGTACTGLYKPATVDPADDPTYQIQPDDKGYVIRLRVTSDVNGDKNHTYLPAAVDYDTAPTAVITDRPLPPTGPGSGGGGNGGGQAAADTTAPIIAGLTASKTKFVAGKGTVFSLQTSEAGKVRMVITKPTSGRKVKGVCSPLTKKNKTKKKCTYQKVLTTIEQPVGAGPIQIPFSGKIGKKKLAPGTYTATIVVFDGAGNPSAPLPIKFTIKRK